LASAAFSNRGWKTQATSDPGASQPETTPEPPNYLQLISEDEPLSGQPLHLQASVATYSSKKGPEADEGKACKPFPALLLTTDVTGCLL